ncbi:MAG: dihydrodipicolinate synthase family protein [Aestuariivita sp.]|nr:dihydrodipicolinate synthase family protein [Aestuariivita sp.]MCY4201981.1 dihydrodipicolinate synthase family protein [Aestuariivita sp.]
MKIQLPDACGSLANYNLIGSPLKPTNLTQNSARVFYAAAHVVPDPLSRDDPTEAASIDWESTLTFRRYLAELGLGIAEAMDTAQRGMGLDWENALRLIRHTREDLPNALVANGCGTDHLNPSETQTLENVQRAYLDQVEAVQKIGGRVILMASRALCRVAKHRDDYISLYRNVLSSCDSPVILHWLGDMFDPQLAGYWGSRQFELALETCLAIISENVSKIDGIKLSLLDSKKEIVMRRRLPETVKMYTGDDFNFPELIAGDEFGFSHALLGIFDPLATVAVHAANKLSAGDNHGFREILDPTVPLARHIFCAPTQHYKTGVVFLAWLNGFQNHFIMVNGAQSSRSLPYFIDCFKLSDQCGLFRDPDLAIDRMRHLLKIYGL